MLSVLLQQPLVESRHPSRTMPFIPHSAHPLPHLSALLHWAYGCSDVAPLPLAAMALLQWPLLVPWHRNGPV